jgi:hypothetical protein
MASGGAPSAGRGGSGTSGAGAGGDGSAGEGGFDGGTGGSGGATAGSGNVPLPPALTWTREPSSGLGFEGIWGSGPDDVYAVGRTGTIIHRGSDGMWSLQGSDTGAILTGVWGSGAGDVYASVDSNFILHTTGDGEWEHQPLPAGYTSKDIWGTGATEVLAVVGNGAIRSEGTGSWEIDGTAPNSNVGSALWGSSPTDLYLATSFANAPTIYHSVGDGTWRPQAGSPEVTLLDIWGTGPDHIYVAGGRSVYFSRGDGVWTPELTVTGFSFDAVWAANRESVYACTQDGLFYRSNGAGTWSEPQTIDPTQNSLFCTSIWGTDPKNLYLATGNGIYHGTAP